MIIAISKAYTQAYVLRLQVAEKAYENERSSSAYTSSSISCTWWDQSLQSSSFSGRNATSWVLRQVYLHIGVFLLVCMCACVFVCMCVCVCVCWWCVFLCVYVYVCGWFVIYACGVVISEDIYRLRCNILLRWQILLYGFYLVFLFVYNTEATITVLRLVYISGNSSHF